jgi:deoxyribonuclease-4
LNDSKKDLGSRVDRHETLGNGFLGISLFQRMMEDQRFDGIPVILETPEEERWPEEIRLLRSFLL